MSSVLSFIKIEHTLFSLPFVLMGYLIAVASLALGATPTFSGFCWRRWVHVAGDGANRSLTAHRRRHPYAGVSFSVRT